jgi:hypothetical protein
VGGATEGGLDNARDRPDAVRDQMYPRSHSNEQVIQSDVDEALRLMRMSKASLNSDVEKVHKEDPVSICYRWACLLETER